MTDSALLEYMDELVTVAKFSNKNAHGDRTYSTSTTRHQCRQEIRQHLIVNTQGQEVVARSTLFLGASSSGVIAGLTPDDRITLPDGTTPPILSVDRFGSASLARHEVAHLG